MKTNIPLLGLLAVALIHAAAIFNLEDNLKRAVDVTFQALAEPVQLHNPDCYVAGEACSKARRDILALAEAAANTYIAIKPDAEACYASGAPCNIAKRKELESMESQAAAILTEREASESTTEDASDDGEANDLESRSAEPRSRFAANRFCYQAGEVCTKRKRSPIALPEPRRYTANKFCYQVGEVCTKKKRAAAAVAEALPKYATTKFCFQAGESCVKAKRSLEQLSDLAATSR